MLKMVICAAAVVVAAPAVSQGDATSASAKPDKVKKVCRREMSTGSILPNRVCHTADEWKAIDQQNASDAENALSQHPAGHPN